MNDSSSLNQLYQEVIMDHSQEPSNFGPLEAVDAVAEGYNPVCGDRIRVELRVGKDDSHDLEMVGIQGEACSICMASASMMTERCSGHSIDDSLKSIASFRALLQGESCGSFLSDLSDDLMALEGVKRFPARIKCALLPWMALKDAIDQLPEKR